MISKGQNQTFVRDNNMKLILFSLLEESMACSDLAEKLALSKPAMTKITSEMLELELIVSAEKKERKDGILGRNKTYLSINDHVGIVAAIDFSTVNIRIGLYSLSGKELLTREIVDSEFITEEILQRVSGELSLMLQDGKINGKELLCLCVGASGKVDKQSGEIVVSPKFYHCRNVNLKQYFEKQFNVAVLVKNDMDLSLLAEKKYGTLRDGECNDAVLIYVDSGIGGAVLSDGNILSGHNGFAGELGLVVTVDDDGKECAYDQIASINSVKEKIALIQQESGEKIFEGKFRFRDVAEAFHAGNRTVRNIVLRSADLIARLCSGLIDLLDCKRILIAGRVSAFGREYLDRIGANALLSNRPVSISFSEVDHSVLLGAASLAIETAFDLLIARRKMNVNQG